MEGNRRITLLEPQPTGERDIAGQRKEGPERSYTVWAVRKDKSSAAEGDIGAGIQGGEWKTEFSFREESAPRWPDETWKLLDERGRRYDIEGVFERNSGSRARWIVVIAARRRAR